MLLEFPAGSDPVADPLLDLVENGGGRCKECGETSEFVVCNDDISSSGCATPLGWKMRVGGEEGWLTSPSEL